MTNPATPPANLIPPVAFTDFNAPLDIVYDEDASETLDHDYWRVGKGFTFYMDGSKDHVIVIPQGYLTDGASVPSWFWDVIPPWGRYGQAAVVHDWLCENLTVTIKGVATPIDRSQADKAFKEGMIALNVPRWKRNIMYIAVRCYAAYVAARAELGLGGYEATRQYTAKQTYVEAHPTMVLVDNETVPFDV